MRQSGKALTTLLGVAVGAVVLVLLGLLAKEFYVYVSAEPSADRGVSDDVSTRGPRPEAEQAISGDNNAPPTDKRPGRQGGLEGEVGVGRVGPREIAGLVRKPNGETLVGADVVIREFGGERREIARLLTGDDGRFQKKGIEGRFCQVTVSSKGLVAQTETKIIPGERYLTFRLEKGGAIRGKVTAALDGVPVPGALISARAYIDRRRLWTASVEADGDGRYRIADAPARSVHLEVEAPGYQTGVSQGVLVRAGAEFDYDIRLRKGLRIHGFVVDGENGNGVAGAKVAFGMRLVNEREVVTDDSGAFSIEAIARGIQFFQVEAEGFGELKQSMNVKAISDEGLRFELYKARTLRGRVVGPGEEKIARAKLFLGVDSAYIPPRAEPVGQTDGQGRFEIEDLTAGHEYYILVRHSDYPDKVSEKVELLEYLDRPLVIQLTEGATLVGRVENRTGEPIADARIMVSDIFDPDEPEERFPATPKRLERDRGRSDEEGKFVVRNLSPGPKRVVVSAGPAYLSKTTDVGEIAEGETSDEVVVVLTSGEVIAGTVVGTDDAPIAEVRLQASSNDTSNPSFGSATTKDDGTFRISQLAGDSFKISARRPGFSVEFRDEVPAGTEDLRIILSKNGTVSGNARSKATREPVSRFLVRMTRTSPVDAPFSRSRQFTSDEGYFYFPDIMPGEYRIEITAKDFAPGVREAVVVQSGEETTSIDVELSEGGVLKGSVTDTRGQPVPRATVFAKSSTPGAANGSPSSRRMPQSKSALVEADGMFRIGGLGDGEYEVYASAPKYSVSPTVLIPIADGTVASRDFTLSQGSQLIVNVTKDGAPLFRAQIEVLDGGRLVFPSRIERILERYPPGSEQRTNFIQRLYRTDQRGTVKILNLPVGSFQVRVTAEDGSTTTESVTLEEGGTVTLNIDLR